jgi:hypothetical protein
MIAPWVSVMRLGNLQLECGLSASFQLQAPRFYSAGTIGIAMAELAAQDFQSLNFQSLNDPIT